MYFYDWLKRYRAVCHLTQQELADALGYAEITYRRVERGYAPSPTFINRLIAYLQVPADEQAAFRHFALTHQHPAAHDLLVRVTHPRPWEMVVTSSQTMHLNDTIPPLAKPPPVLNFVGRQNELVFYHSELKTRHLVMINGMTGVGKTALASVLAQQYTPLDYIFWYQFYPHVGIHDLLWRLTAFLAWHGEDALWLQQYAHTQSGPTLPLETQIDYLVHALQRHDFLMCLDDLQYVETNDHFIQFIDRMIPTLTEGKLSLMITSRQMPACAHMSSGSPLQGLSEADTQALLIARNLVLPVVLITDLWQATHGNPALLMLAIDAFRGASRPDMVIGQLARVPNIVHYLMKTIHTQLSHNAQAIGVMQALAILQGTLATRDVIAAVLHEDSVWETLYDLGRRYLVHTHQNSTGEPLYMQHTLVQAFYYEQLGLTTRHTLHLRAAQYYMHNDHTLLDALHHFSQAGAYQKMVEIITDNLWGLINRGYAQAISEMLERLNTVDLAEAQWLPFWFARGTIATFLRASSIAHESYQCAWDYLALMPGTHITRHQQAQVCLGMGELLKYEQPQEALCWLLQGLAMLPELSTFEAGRLYRRLGGVYRMLGEYALSQQAFETSLCMLATQYERERAHALTGLGILAFTQSRFQQGRDYLTQALQIYQSIGQFWSILVIYQNMALLLEMSGAWKEAITIYTQALTLAERLHHIVRQAELILNLGTLKTKQGDFSEAHELLKQSLAQAQQHQLYRMVVLIQVRLADLYVRIGNYVMAAHTLTTAAHLADELADQRVEIARTWALVHLAQGDYGWALTYAQKAVQQAQSCGEQLEHGISLRVLGQVQCAYGRYDQAYTVFTQSITLVHDDPYEIAQTRAHWGIALLGNHRIGEGIASLQKAQATFEQLEAWHDLAWTNKMLTDLAPNVDTYSDYVFNQYES